MVYKYLLFILVFGRKVHCSCLRDTFSNTSVTLTGVRGNINTISGCFSPEIKNLERVALVQIINETVPVLYEDAFNNLENLVDIILERDRIQEIHPGAFKNLAKLYLLKIRYNNVQEIKFGVFNNLLISELSLVNNNIEIIQSGALDDMPNLYLISLGENKIKNLDPDWFNRSPKLSVLNFEHNQITKIPGEAFKNIAGIHAVNKLNVSTSIHLNNNKIQTLEDGAFNGLKSLGWLFLQRNEITDFNVNSLGSLQQLDWLRLDFNNLSCIPEKLLEIAPNVKYYLEGNPLTDACKAKFEIKTKNNGIHLNKFNIIIN